MKIAIRGGHNYGVTGAHGILDEVTEDRKYYKAVAGYLRAAGHEVIDVTPERTATSADDLNYGVSRANKAKVDLFISCHLNAGGGKGCEALYHGSSTKGKDYAVKVSNAIAALGFANRGAKADVRGLYELKYTDMPAIIIEPLFVDSQTDVDVYKKVGFDRLAKVIAEAVSGKAIVEVPKYPGYLIKFNPGKLDENVKLVQQKLGIKADGYFGNNTLIAVQKFQKAHGLQPDGIVGKLTWARLFD
jgi:N-acetylmuramoyl-L-alanine amidase